MIRGGHVDLTVLGAFEVDCQRQYRVLHDPGQTDQRYGRRNGFGGWRRQYHRDDDACF